MCTEVAYVKRFGHHFQGQKVKGQLAGGGAYCGGLPQSLFLVKGDFSLCYDKRPRRLPRLPQWTLRHWWGSCTRFISTHNPNLRVTRAPLQSQLSWLHVLHGCKPTNTLPTPSPGGRYGKYVLLLLILLLLSPPRRLYLKAVLFVCVSVSGIDKKVTNGFRRFFTDRIYDDKKGICIG